MSSQAIAAFLEGDHRGPPVQLVGIGSLERATGRQLAFSVYQTSEPLGETDAGAVICPPDVGPVDGQTQIVVADPRLSFAKAANEFFRPDDDDSEARIHDTAHVHDAAEIGAGTRIGPHAVIDGCVRIGPRCTIRAGTVIGGAGFGFARDDDAMPHRLPHTGSVEIGADVEIGPNCTIDRAVFHETTIEADAKLSAGVHVAHNVTIGPAALVAFGAGFGGGATVGAGAMIHPEVTVAEGVAIGDSAEVGMNSTVLEDVADGVTVVGSPARPIGRDEENETT